MNATSSTSRNDPGRAGLAGAATAGDLVLVSVPVLAFGKMPSGALAGRVVMDTGNYYPRRDGQHPDLDSGALTSSELLQRDLPGGTPASAETIRAALAQATR